MDPFRILNVQTVVQVISLTDYYYFFFFLTDLVMGRGEECVVVCEGGSSGRIQ